jgi:outer membrane biosynthesis protein TonB
VRRLAFPLDLKPTFEQMLSRRDQLSLAASLGILGSYFFWVSTTEVDDTFDVDDIDDRFKVAMGIVKEKPEEEEQEKDELAQKDEEKEEEKEKPEPKPEKKLDKKPEKFSDAAMAKARNVGIARVLGTYGGPGEGTVFDVIESTENNLGDLFAQGMTTTMLADGGDITPFVPGGEGISLRGTAVDNAGLTTAEGPELARNDKMERKITAKTKTTSTDVFGDVDKNALRAYINRRTSALRSCYEQALRTQPNVAGKMRYVIDISTMGSVTGVRVMEDTLGVPSVKTCTMAKIKGWRFPKGEDTAEVDFSVVFSGGS